MERGADLEPLNEQAVADQGIGGPVQRGEVTRDHELLAGVVVADDDHFVGGADRAAYLLDVCRVAADDRRHPRRPGGGRLHELAALAHDAHRIGELHGSAADEGRVLPEAVAGQDGRVDPGVVKQRLGHRVAHGEDRGLGVVGARELVEITREAQRPKVKSERVVRLVEDPCGGRVGLDELPAHRDVLSALACAHDSGSLHCLSFGSLDN